MGESILPHSIFISKSMLHRLQFILVHGLAGFVHKLIPVLPYPMLNLPHLADNLTHPRHTIKAAAALFEKSILNLPQML